MDVKARLIQAVHDRELATVAEQLRADTADDSTGSDAELLRAAARVCVTIRSVLVKERDSVSRYLDGAGIAHSFNDQEFESPQIHQFSVKISEGAVCDAIDLLASMGYSPPHPMTPLQQEIVKRVSDRLVLTRIDEVTMRVRLRWPRVVPSGLVGKLWPKVEDGELLRLRPGFWWLAFFVRPVSVVLRRAGLLARHSSVGEFLGTPEELVPALLDFAQISSDDTVCDLGCGDGRILIEAAKRYGCRGIGYEHDESLCDVARKRAEEQGVSDLVSIRADDVSRASMDSVTAVFLFLPPATVSALLPRLLSELAGGARIVAHEQSPMKLDVSPDRSAPLFAESALTVAHLWAAQER